MAQPGPNTASWPRYKVEGTAGTIFDTDSISDACKSWMDPAPSLLFTGVSIEGSIFGPRVGLQYKSNLSQAAAIEQGQMILAQAVPSLKESLGSYLGVASEQVGAKTVSDVTGIVQQGFAKAGEILDTAKTTVQDTLKQVPGVVGSLPAVLSFVGIGAAVIGIIYLLRKGGK